MTSATEHGGLLVVGGYLDTRTAQRRWPRARSTSATPSGDTDLLLTAVRSGCPPIRARARTIGGDLGAAVLAVSERADVLIVGATIDHRRGLSSLAVDGTVLAVTNGADAHALLGYAFQYARQHAAPARIACRLPKPPATFEAAPSSHEADEWLFDVLSVWQNTYPNVRLSGGADRR